MSRPSGLAARSSAEPNHELTVICIPTYMRPVGLARLLDSIDAMDSVRAMSVEVVVIDNDAEGSASWCEGREVLGRVVHYELEPTRGITYARNRALRAASELEADWVAWLDDDEAPRHDWLERIVEVQRTSAADIVIGPSVPVFDADAPDWIVETGAFQPERFVTGHEFPYFHTRTSGVIVRAAVIPVGGFDDRLALIGGEDRLLFTLIHREGARFVWADDAVVDEFVPTSRVSIRWLVRRWFRTGVTRSLVMVYVDQPSLGRRLRRLLGGLWMATAGLVGMVKGLRRGRSATLMASRKSLLGLGASWGALGMGFEEYREVHGA